MLSNYAVTWVEHGNTYGVYAYYNKICKMRRSYSILTYF